MGKLDFLLRSIDALNDRVGKAVSLVMAPMIAIVVFEVACRYGFNAPTEWSFEVSKFIFGGYIALGGAYTLLHGGHVNMDIVYNRLSPRKKAIVDVITATLFFLFCGVFFWEILKVTWEAILTGQKVGSGAGFDPQVWPIFITICIGALLILLQGTAGFIRNLRTVLRRRD
jgi:TRAP-type mannitol/chloroaromatic compound transport system permease small subunit